MGALDAGLAQDQANLLRPDQPAPRAWNRGVWIRFALAIIPIAVFAVLGAIEQHLLGH